MVEKKMSHVSVPAMVHVPVRSARRPILDLGGTWSLRVDPERRGACEGWPQGTADFEIPAPVPGAVNALPALGPAYPSHQQPNAYEGDVWYRRRFRLPANWRAERAWLQFGGVMPAAHVWLNGVYLGFHNLSPVAVKFDATAAVRAENVLTVCLPWQDVGLRGGLVFGSGLWRTVELEGTDAVRIEDLFIRPRLAAEQADLSLRVHNDGDAPCRVTLHATATPAAGGAAEFRAESAALDVPPGGAVPVAFTLPMPDAQRWTPDTPHLYVLSVEARAGDAVADAVTERFGVRQVEVVRDGLRLNGEPLMFRAVCDEFFGCPTLAPILDPALIRRRIETLKSLGFNAKRYHTHVPPREELDLCDELGLLVHAEISVISNFNVTAPDPAAGEVWRAALRQIRNHASFAIYCMGNEGSQVMYKHYDRARQFYDDARALAPDTPILAASGMQGEHPEVPNDFETPHFWARYFAWSYDGLTALPWWALDFLAEKGPLVIHEFGKYTVWPDPAEDAYFREAGMPLKGNYGAMGRLALEEAGLVDLLPRLIRNSRALASVCNRMILEEARRQPFTAGYHVISAFRLNGNRGMADELGRHVDPEFRHYPRVNGPIALLLDRTFRGRTLVAGQTVRVTLHLSHFGAAPLGGACLRWDIVAAGADAASASGTLEIGDFARGRNGPLGDIAFRSPAGTGRIVLRATLEAGGEVAARQEWDFWHFDWPDGRGGERLVSDAADRQREYDLMAALPDLRRLDDAVSVWKGDRICKFADGTETGAYLAARPPRGVIADRWSDALSAYVEAGGRALLLDSGHFPEEWYVPRMERDRAYGAPHLTYDLFAQFAPFRGWSHANAATIVEPHAVFETFPHQGWCDLQFFAMVQGARPLRTARLPGQAHPLIRVIPIWRRTGPQAGPKPDDPDVPRPFETENRVYLSEQHLGAGRLLVSSLRHFADPAGRWLLDRLVAVLGTPGPDRD